MNKKENQIKSFSTNTQAITNRATYMCDKGAYCKEEEEKRIEIQCIFSYKWSECLLCEIKEKTDHQ